MSQDSLTLIHRCLGLLVEVSYTHRCFFLSSPHSHLAVHHTRKVKLGQQVLHLVVFLTVLLHVSVVTGDVRAQHIPHQEGQATLLTVTVFLRGKKPKHAQNSHSEAARVSGDLHRCKSLTFSIRPLAPALKLPVKGHTLNGHTPPSKVNWYLSRFLV